MVNKFLNQLQVYFNIKNRYKSMSNKNELSLASKQSLLSLVRGEINYEQRYCTMLKLGIKDLYELSDKNNPDTFEYFDRMNNIRTENRIVKKRIKKLARIAKELKMSMQ